MRRLSHNLNHRTFYNRLLVNVNSNSSINTYCYNTVDKCGIRNVPYAWPAGTSEETKNRILFISDHELTVEESGIAENKVYEIFESFPPDSKQHKDLMACGYADKLAFEVLQCYRDKGNDIQ